MKNLKEIENLEATKRANYIKELDRLCNERTHDESLSIEERLDALREWIVEDRSSACEFVAEQLQRNERSGEWQKVIVFAAEDLRFESVELRDQVAISLLGIALRLPNSITTGDETTVMSAIRRAGSILPESKIELLLPFLDGGTLIHTRLVTLQSLSRMFWSNPPKDSAEVQRVAERAAAIARKHWDLDVFKAGEISALAIEATLVAAQLGAANATDCVELALATNRRLLLRKLQNLLVEIRDEWQKNHQTDAVTRLNDIVDKIHSA